MSGAKQVLSGDRDLRRRSMAFNVYVALTVLSFVGAIAARRPEILALGAPMLVATIASLALYRRPDVTVALDVDQRRVVEGETVVVTIELASTTGLARADVEIEFSDRLEPQGATRAITSVPPGAATQVQFEVVATRWGVAPIGRITIGVTDRFGLFGGRTDFATDETVRIGLPDDRLEAALEADRFRRIAGSHQSLDRGQGLEIADIRPFQQGDSLKSINWRISNRRQEPWVTLRHPDRSTTLVLVVDAHEGDDAYLREAQRRSVGAALALTRTHLSMHDQVGLLVVGHTLNWLPPRLGRTQLFAISDELVAVGNPPDASLRLYRAPAVANIPTEAIVVALSPLFDPLMVSLLAGLRNRGNPVSVLVPKIPRNEPLVRRPARHASEARRLAALEHDIGVQSLRERGVAIVQWDGDEPVESVTRSLQRMRQSMARARTW